MTNTTPYEAELLALAIENSELRLQLAHLQDECIELAVDGGELHAEILALRAQLAELVEQRDAWQSEAERFRPPSRVSAR
nr:MULTISPECIES: hypothetical protein [unclassified Methylobacterium]